MSQLPRSRAFPGSMRGVLLLLVCAVLMPLLVVQAGIYAAWYYTRWAVEVQADPQAEPDGEDLHILLFQSVRELLFNVVKHGRTGRARVEMAAAPRGKVRLEVSDDGAGFDPASLNADRSAGGGFGLFSIRERLELLGGRLEVEASPGHGSRMTIFVPRRRSNAGAGPSRKGERRLPRPAAASLQEPTP